MRNSALRSDTANHLIGRRAPGSARPVAFGDLVDSPAAAARVARGLAGGAGSDETLALYLDSCFRLLRARVVAGDQLGAAFLGVRDILGCGLEGAHAFVLVRRHRDGSLEPSPTEAMVAASLRMRAAAAGVPMLDHVVVGQAGGYWSQEEHR